MEIMKITGGRRLYGDVSVCSAKNAVLPILACCLLCDGEVKLRNCAPLGDILDMIKIVSAYGVKSRFEGSDIILDGRNVKNSEADCAVTGRIRSSVFILGPLIGRLGEACVSYPGGCDIGLRPIDLHIYGLGKLGVKVTEEDGKIVCDGQELTGGEIVFDFPSVGATENAIMAAATAKGRTLIRNAAREPEIVDLAKFINACGGKVYGAGGDVITVDGVESLSGCEFTPVPDRIIGGTFLAAVAAAGGDVFIRNLDSSLVSGVIEKFSAAGADITRDGNGTRVTVRERLRAVAKIETQPYSGFPTDMQAQTVAALSTAIGTSVMVENLFENRFGYTKELNKMGARIAVKDRVAVVRGVRRLRGTSIEARDLRGGAALIVAALGADGESTISGLSHVDRGYFGFERDLALLGADAVRKRKSDGSV